MQRTLRRRWYRQRRTMAMQEFLLRITHGMAIPVWIGLCHGRNGCMGSVRLFIRRKLMEIGLSVFFGYESCYQGTEFLIYGVDEEWLLTHPEIKDATITEQLQLVREQGGLVMHAHPFREEAYIPRVRLFPELVDGVEGINATHSSHLSTSHNDPRFDERAIAYAREHDLPMSAGSDVHSTLMLGGGIAFQVPLVSGRDYAERIRGRKEDYVLTNGDQWFDRFGNRIDD